MKRRLFAALSISAIFFAISAFSAQASVFTFSFSSDGTIPIPRIPVAGTVTGLIFGLSDNGAAQIPTSVEILSSPIGINNVTFSHYGFGGLNVIGGVIVGGSLGIGDANFDNVLDLNANSVANALVQNSGLYVTANSEGFTGVTFGIAAVPEPSTWAMIILGFVGIGFMANRRRKVLA